MYTDVQDLVSSTLENFGGLPYFDFVPREWIATPFYPDSRTRIVTTVITLTAGKSWLRASCLVNTMEYQERQKEELGDSYYEGILSGAVLRDNVTKINLTDVLRFHELVAVYYDRNNIGRVIGGVDKGMRFKSDFTTGLKGSDNTMYGFTLSILLDQRAPLYLVGGGGTSTSGGGTGGIGDPDNPTS